jgi:hypothetical protein
VHLDFTNEVAYVVFPATFTLRMNGKRSSQRECRWTVVMHKVASGWRMTSWAWSDGAKYTPKAGAAE